MTGAEFILVLVALPLLVILGYKADEYERRPYNWEERSECEWLHS